MQSHSLLAFAPHPKRVTEADRVLAAIDRHYRRCQRRGAIPMWVRQRRGEVVLRAAQRASTFLHLLAVKAELKAARARIEMLRNPKSNRKALLWLAKHELRLARHWCPARARALSLIFQPSFLGGLFFPRRSLLRYTRLKATNFRGGKSGTRA